jgi:hypothetical protein
VKEEDPEAGVAGPTRKSIFVVFLIIPLRRRRGAEAP